MKSFYYLNQGFPLFEKLWDGLEDDYEVQFVKEKYLVDAKKKKIFLLNFKNKDFKVPTTFYPILINYLKNLKFFKELSFNDNNFELVPPEFRQDWSLFFRAVHSLKEELILSVVKNLKDFDDIISKFAIKKLDSAESSYLVEPLKGVYIGYLYWEGDEDFPPSLKILFDKRLADVFIQDMVWGVIVELNARIRNYEYYFSLFD